MTDLFIIAVDRVIPLPEDLEPHRRSRARRTSFSTVSRGNRRSIFPHHELVTATFDIEQAAQAFQASDDPEQVKVLITIGK